MVQWWQLRIRKTSCFFYHPQSLPPLNIVSVENGVQFACPLRERETEREKERTARCLFRGSISLRPRSGRHSLMKLTQRQIVGPRGLDPRQGVVEAAAAVHRVLRVSIFDLLRLRVHALAFDPHVLRVFVVPRVQFRRPPPNPLPGLFAVALAGGRGCDREHELFDDAMKPRACSQVCFRYLQVFSLGTAVAH